MKNFFVSFIVATFFLVTLTFTATAQTTVAITGNTSDAENDPGWYFQRDQDNVTGMMFTNQKSSIGNGSLYGGTIGATANEKFIAELFMLTPIADLNSFSFDFMIGGSGTGASYNQFYLTVYALGPTAPDTKFYDCRYNAVATSGSISIFKTVTFDPTQAYPVTTSGSSTIGACPAIPANMPAGSKIRVYAINIGDTSASDVGLGGYLDNVVVKLTSGTTIYNFEMSSRECKNGGWSGKIGSDGNPYANQGRCVSDTEQRRAN